MPKVRKAMEYVADKILAENEKDVMESFYNRYQPTEYDRSYQFVNAWDFDDIQMTDRTASMEFGISPDKMEYDPDDYLHGSYASGDAREYLVDILYDGVWGGLFGDGPWRRKSRAFDILVNKLDKDKFDRWMKTGMKRAGLSVM